MDRPRARAPAVAETVACVITHFCGAAGDVEFDEFKDWWYKQHFSDEWERERALDNVRKDIRAIYGSTKRPLSVHDLAMQIEKSFHKVSTDLSDHSGNEVQ
jgi:hypothetical protein